MPFNISAGLSSMGGAVAATAGTAALEQQKSDLERQNLALASNLAEGRESRLETQRQAGASQLETQRQAGAITLAQTTSKLGIEAQKEEAENAADLTKKLGSDPDYIAAQKNLASADPLKTAQAADAMAQAALYGLQTDTAKKVADARQEIIDEESKDNPDPAKLTALNQKFNTLLTDPAAASALRTAAVANARVNEDAASRAEVDLNAATAKLQDPNISGDPAARAALEANVKNLSMRVKVLNKAADDARAQANSLFGGPVLQSNNNQSNPPDLSKYLRQPGTKPPPPASAPGLINSPP